MNIPVGTIKLNQHWVKNAKNLHQLKKIQFLERSLTRTFCIQQSKAKLTPNPAPTSSSFPFKPYLIYAAQYICSK